MELRQNIKHSQNFIKKPAPSKERVTPELFSGTHKYYADYRPGIPAEVIEVITTHFDIKPNDRILDIGCGTGQVALAMDGKCAEMVCFDSDPAMIERAQQATGSSSIKLTWIARGSEDLGELKKELGTFKVATISRAFHWMDQDQILRDLDQLVDEDGGIAVFGDGSFWTGQEEWQIMVKKIVQKYLGTERRAGKSTFKESDERWEDKIAGSRFRFVTARQVPVTRQWGVESIVGWLFSSSFATPDHFGDRVGSFKRDIEEALLQLNPQGIFREDAVFSIIMASRNDRQ